MQQLTEVTLCDGLQRFSHVALRLGHTMQTIEQDEQEVTLTVRGADGSGVVMPWLLTVPVHNQPGDWFADSRERLVVFVLTALWYHPHA